MRGVEEYDKFGSLITLYYSTQSAAKTLQVSNDFIIKLINSGEIYNRKIYKFYDSETFSNGCSIYPIKQYNVNTGEIINQFKTITEAAVILNYHRNNISKCIKSQGVILDKWGYGWKRKFDVD